MIPAIVDVSAIVETLTDNVDKLVDASKLIRDWRNGLSRHSPCSSKRHLKSGRLIKHCENTPKLADAAVSCVDGKPYHESPALVSSAAEIVSTIVKGITDLITDFIDIGDKIVKGIWKGISDGYTWIIGKIKGWVGNLVDFCKSILGIHSPSTVFAGIGGYMAQGMGNGFYRL